MRLSVCRNYITTVASYFDFAGSSLYMLDINPLCIINITVTKSDDPLAPILHFVTHTSHREEENIITILAVRLRKLDIHILLSSKLLLTTEM